MPTESPRQAWNHEELYKQMASRKSAESSGIPFQYEYWVSFCTNERTIGVVDNESDVGGVWIFHTSEAEASMDFYRMPSPGAKKARGLGFSTKRFFPQIYFHPEANLAVARTIITEDGFWGKYVTLIVWAFQTGMPPFDRLSMHPSND
jgi:hypothetical protein